MRKAEAGKKRALRLMSGLTALKSALLEAQKASKTEEKAFTVK
jgi:hypothetical protein